MKDNRNRKRGKLSAGTVFVLTLLGVVLIGSALVLGRLSSGASVDLSRLTMNVLDLSTVPSGQDETETGPETAKATASVFATAIPTSEPAAAVPEKQSGSFSLTIGGSICLSDEVRKNSWSTDAKMTDYTDTMMLIAPRIRGDVKGVFLENLLSDREKVSDIVAGTQAAGLLTEAGFDLAACGFSQSYAKGRSGIEDTLGALESRGIRPVGIRDADATGTPEIRSIQGVRTVFLQYTATMASKTRKSMEKDGTAEMVPDAEIDRISADISAARLEGAEAVIVLISWGKNAKDPDKTQKELAAQIARAGADLIVGNGSHVAQGAEYLSGKDGKPVLCVWCLGSLLNGDRSNIRRIAGYLLHVTVRSDGKGGAEILQPEYTPVYTWKYKQDGRTYYRVIAADGEAPDGMDREQASNRTKAAEAVDKVLKDSPLTPRGSAYAD